MKTYTGSPWQRLDPEIREALAPMDRFLREVGPAIGRISLGKNPDGSGATIGSARIGVADTGTALVDYLYLPGRTSGVQTVSGDVTFLGTVTLSGQENVTDSLFSILDNLDPTKIAQFQCSGIATATTRTYTLPDASGTLALTSTVDTARTWATLQTFKDTTLKVVDDANATKTLSFSLGGALANADLTLAWAGTVDRTVTLPDDDGSIPTIQYPYTITGGWTFDANSGLDFTFNATPGAGIGAGSFVFRDETTGNQMDFGLAGLPTTNRSVYLPDGDGTLITTASSATLTNKTMGPSCSLRVSTSTNGVAFVDNTVTTKKLRPILSGSVGDNTLTVANTAARDYKLTDYSASGVLVGNTTAAAGTLGKSDLTAQAGSIGATTMLTASANSSGAFRLTFYIVNTVIGNAADTLKVTAAWNDGAAQAADVLLTNAIAAPAASAILHSLTTVGNASYGTINVYAAASTAITFTTTATLVGTPQYTCRTRIEALG